MVRRDDRKAGAVMPLPAGFTLDKPTNLPKGFTLDTPQTAAPDFTANPKGEGLYRLLPASNQGFVRSEDAILVPFSRVKDALGAGYHLHPDEAPRYQKDFAHQGEGPTLLERAKSKFAAVTEPLADVPLEWNQPGGRTARGFVRSIPAAVQNVEQMPWNFTAAGARGVVGLAGLPAQAAETLQQISRGDPQGMENLMDITPPGIGKNLWESYQNDAETLGPNAALANLSGNLATLYAAGKVAGKVAEKTPGIGELRQVAAERARAPFKPLEPRTVEITGQKIPVLVGEAAPETRAGRMQTSLKKAGTGGAKFDAVSRAQQAAVKNVIRRVAQQTSGLVGPMAEEPGTAMSDAADATFAKARPMYSALDASLARVPDGLQEVSRITQEAMGRAQKLGVDITDPGITGEFYVDKEGNAVDRGSMSPAKFEDAVRRGDLTTKKLAEGQPIGTYMKVRSQLLKMQRSTPDAAMRNAISNEVRAMNDNMEAALKGTPLYENWQEANRLWSKGYALRDVADAITKTTKGTPAAQQAPGLAPIPTRVQGPNLVNRLNVLEQDGILDRAFTHDETANLRQAVDILDRARAAAGGGGSFTHGYSPRSVIWRAILKLPTLPLVNAMTRLDGLDALKAAETAKTPSALATALSGLATIAAANQVPKNRKEAMDAAKAKLQQ